MSVDTNSKVRKTFRLFVELTTAHMLRFWSMFLYGYGQHNSNPWWCQHSPKPYQTWDFYTAIIALLRVLQRVCQPKKAQTMRLAYRKRLPPPSFIPSRRPKASWRAQMLPHSAHRTTLPKRPGVTMSTAHWRRVEKARGVQKGLSSLIQ